MIVDTSVLYDSVVEGPRSAAARAALGEADEPIAPDLIEYEIASALTKAVRRRDLDEEGARESLAHAWRVMPNRQRSIELVPRAFEMSLELSHALPDCIFLALAEARRVALLTCDERFARKLAATPFAKLVHLVTGTP